MADLLLLLINLGSVGLCILDLSVRARFVLNRFHDYI